MLIQQYDIDRGGMPTPERWRAFNPLNLQVREGSELSEINTRAEWMMSVYGWRREYPRIREQFGE